MLSRGAAMNAKGTPNGRRPSAAQLRDLIDKGRTRDKVPSFDPAAVPLGTDDEAAGTPTGGPAVESAITEEARQAWTGYAAETRPHSRRWAWIAGLLALVVTLGIFVLVL